MHVMYEHSVQHHNPCYDFFFPTKFKLLVPLFYNLEILKC